MTKLPEMPAIAPAKAPELPFGKCGGKRLEVVADEPELSSDGGVLLLRDEAARTGIFGSLAGAIEDRRVAGRVTHSVEAQIAQRVLQICQGAPDANDAARLRDDPLFKLGVGLDPQAGPLSSQPTLSRLENAVTQRDLIRLGYALVDRFVASYTEVPKLVCLDLDPSAHLLYGQQELGLYNTHVDEYCLMPFYLFEGLSGKLITALVRPGKTPTAAEIISVLKRVVKRLRRAWPETLLVLRADSHHTKPDVLDWLEDHQVDYVLGLAPNAVLNRTCEALRGEVKRQMQRQLHEYRRYHSFDYAAGTWSRSRRVICRALANDHGTDLRYIVTSLTGAGAKYLYETVYSGRGNAERMIKEMKLDLTSDRSSCTSALANQFRLFLHGAAYQLMHGFRERVLAGTELATTSFGTLRWRLLKVAVRVVCTARTIRLHLPASLPHWSIWQRASALVAGAPGP